MLGSRVSWRERLLLGWLAPRDDVDRVRSAGVQRAGRGAEHTVALVMVVAVLGSVVIHGVGAPAAVRAYQRSIQPNWLRDV